MLRAVPGSRGALGTAPHFTGISVLLFLCLFLEWFCLHLPVRDRFILSLETHSNIWRRSHVEEYSAEFIPDWGWMRFLVDILRPISPSMSEEETSWFNTLKRAGGGCNDLVYSGHMLVAVLTAMAWTEAYPGWTSAVIWFLVLHSAQREIRERHHYSVDCVVAIYVGILLWRTTGFIWSAKDRSKMLKLERLARIEGRLVQAAKDADVEKVRELLKEAENPYQDQKPTKWALWGFASFVIIFSLGIGLLAFTWTADG